jgi:hypothetical protein
VQVFLPFAASGQEVEFFVSLRNMPALFAALKRSSLALKCVLAEVFLSLGVLETCL